jgi:hypothetical protein
MVTVAFEGGSRSHVSCCSDRPSTYYCSKVWKAKSLYATLLLSYLGSHRGTLSPISNRELPFTEEW